MSELKTLLAPARGASSGGEASAGQSFVTFRSGLQAFRLLFLATVACCVLFSLPAQSQDQSSVVTLKLDHVSFAISDLEALRASLSSVGLTPGSAEPHGNATRTASIRFENQTAIEMIGPEKSGVIQGSDWVKLITGDAGACFWAAVTSDLQQEAVRLKKKGIPVTPPERGSYRRPDGVIIEWMTAQVGAGSPGSILPVLVEDRTPRVWRTQISESARGASVIGVEKVVIGFTNLDVAVAIFRKVFNWSEPVTECQEDFGRLAYFPGQPVILASPAGGGWFADRLSRFGEGPVAALLGAPDFNAACKRYRLSKPEIWFGQRVGWFAPDKLKSVRLGVIGE